MPTFHVEADPRSGSFPVDLTPDVLGLEWRLGLAQAYDSVAEPGTAEIRLLNGSQERDRPYSPEVSPGLTTGTPLRILSRDGPTTRLHFTGQIEAIAPDAGRLGAKTVLITARTLDAQFARQQVNVGLLTDVTADTVIQALAEAAKLRRFADAGFFYLDSPGYAELDAQTRLFGPLDVLALEPGVSRFAYVADSWATTLSVGEAIRQAVFSERGRFYADREGKLRLLNRHHLLADNVVAATFNDSMDGLRYGYGTALRNRVTVHVTTRTVGPPGSVLWTLPTAQRLGAGEELRLNALFRDANGQPLGVLRVEPPVAGLDYRVSADPTGLGRDLSAQVPLLLVEATATGATLRIRNGTRAAVYLLAGAQVRGTPLLPGDALAVMAEDGLSIHRHGIVAQTLDLPLLSSAEDAGQIARFEVARRGQARGAVQSLTLSGRQHTQARLQLTLFDRIRVHEPQTGSSGDAFIVAEAHRVSQGGSRHSVTYTLEPVAGNRFWLTDQDTLDQTTILAY